MGLINGFFFCKKKNVLLGNRKSFHSAQVRYTFIHVYIHAHQNLRRESDKNIGMTKCFGHYFCCINNFCVLSAMHRCMLNLFRCKDTKSFEITNSLHMEKRIKNNKIVWFYCNPPAAEADSHFTIQAESGGKTGRIVGQFSPFHSAIQALLREFNWTPTTHEGWGSYKKKKVFNISASSVLPQNVLTIRPLQLRQTETDKKHLFWVCSRITDWQSGSNIKKQICLQIKKNISDSASI